MKHGDIPARNRQIRAAHSLGECAARLAVLHNLTTRQIHHILSDGTKGRGRPPRARVLDADELKTYRKLRRLIGIEATRKEMRL